jgi:hypothetical protein
MNSMYIFFCRCTRASAHHPRPRRPHHASGSGRARARCRARARSRRISTNTCMRRGKLSPAGLGAAPAAAAPRAARPPGSQRVAGVSSVVDGCASQLARDVQGRAPPRSCTASAGCGGAGRRRGGGTRRDGRAARETAPAARGAARGRTGWHVRGGCRRPACLPARPPPRSAGGRPHVTRSGPSAPGGCVARLHLRRRPGNEGRARAWRTWPSRRSAGRRAFRASRAARSRAGRMKRRVRSCSS